jgi:hypothetical protein
VGRSVDSGDKPFKEISDVALLMYVGDGTSCRSVSSRGPLVDPRHTDWPASSVTLQCIDLNNDGTDEVMVDQGRVGASWTPGCAFVFRVRAKGFALVGTITSHYEIRVRDLDGDNRREIPSTYAIGTTMPHSAQPRWTDYYGYNGRRMALVNSRLSAQFPEWPAQLKRALAKHPDDPELLFFLGYSYGILGRDREAKGAFAKARSLGYRKPDRRALQAGIEVEEEIPANAALPSR